MSTLNILRENIRIFLSIVPMVMSPIGLLLNLATIFVYNRKSFRKEIHGYLYIIQGIFDNLLILITWLQYYSIGIGNDFTLISNFNCKIISFLIRFLAQMPAWIQVLITVTRALSIRSSIRFSFLKNKTKMTQVIFLIIIMLILANLANFFQESYEIKIQNVNDTLRTQTVCTGTREVLLARDLCAILFRIIIPFVLMIGFNFLLIKSILASRKRLK